MSGGAVALARRPTAQRPLPSLHPEPATERRPEATRAPVGNAGQEPAYLRRTTAPETGRQPRQPIQPAQPRPPPATATAEAANASPESAADVGGSGSTSGLAAGSGTAPTVTRDTPVGSAGADRGTVVLPAAPVADDSAPPFVAGRLPEPDVGPVRLAPPAPPGGFAAPPFLARPALEATPEAGERELPAYLAGHAVQFAAATDQARRNYDEVLAAARASAAELRLLQLQLAAAAQRTLDRNLDLLDRRLADERQELAAGERQALDRLARIASTARILVRQQATRALGTVAARKRGIEGHMAAATRRRDGVLADLERYLTRVDTAGTQAAGAFDTLAADPAPAHFRPPHPDVARYSPQMEAAMNEDLGAPVAARATRRASDFETAQRLFADRLSNAHSSFLESARQAFQPFDSYLAMLGTTAPQQITSLRRRALAGIGRMERHAAHGIRDQRHRAEAELLKQHNRARRAVAARGESAAAATDRTVVGAAAALWQGHAGLAAGQGQAIELLRARIMAGRRLDPERFARFVGDASARAASEGTRQATAALARLQVLGVSGRAALLTRTHAGGSREEESARQTVATLGRQARQTSLSLLRSALLQETALRSASEPVARSVDAFRIPAQARLEEMERELLARLATAKAQADAAWNGAEAPHTSSAATEAGDSAQSATEPPPPGTGAAPGEFVGLAEARADRPVEDESIGIIRERVGETVVTDVTRREGRLEGQMSVLGNDPQTTLAQLRGLTALRGAALSRKYAVDTKRDLRADLRYYLNVGNPLSGVTTRVESIVAAFNYLNGNRAAGALHEAQAATNLTNDREWAMGAMTAQKPTDLSALRGIPGSDTIIAEVVDDLGGNDGRAFAMLANANADNATRMVAAARALLLEEDLGNQLGSYAAEQAADRGVDLLQDYLQQAGTTALEGVSEYGFDSAFDFEREAARRARIASSQEEMVARFGNRGMRHGEGRAAGAERLEEMFRSRTYSMRYDPHAVPGRHPSYQPGGVDDPYSRQPIRIRDEQLRLVHNLGVFGAGSPEARAARLAVEDSRTGGGRPERIASAYEDQRLNADLTTDRDEQAAGRADEERTFRLYDQYRNDRAAEAAPRPVAEIRAELGARLRENAANAREGELFELQATRGLYDPVTIARSFDVGMRGVGTRERLIKDTLRRLSRGQIAAARAEYDRTHETSLDEALGIFAHEDDWFAEFSGDERLEVQVLAMGQPRNDRERAEVSRMTSRLQIRNAGLLGPLLAGSEYARLTESHGRLLRLMGVDDAQFDERGQLLSANGRPLGNFDEHGGFRPTTPEGRFALAMAMTENELLADNYRAATDAIANAITTAIIVAAAVISTALTGGAAASIWIPVLVTLGAGVAAMAVNHAIKGGRYGYEEMGRDFALAVVQAATAGAAAALTIARTGGTAALRLASTTMKVETAGLRTLSLFEEAMVGGISGGLGGVGNAMLDDEAFDNDTWLANLEVGFARGFLGGLASGLATGAGSRAVSKGAGRLATATAGRGASDAVRQQAAQRAAESAGVRIAGRTLGGGLGGAAGRATEIGVDWRRGNHRTWASGWDDILAAGTQGSIQSFLEGVGEHAADSRRSSRQAIEARLSRTADSEETRRLLPPAEAETALRTPRRPPPGDDGGALALRSEGGPGGGPEGGPRLLVAANDDPGHMPRRIALADLARTGPLHMPRFAEGAVLVHPDATSRTAANDNFGRLVLVDPAREAGIYHNPETGQYIVVQGGPTSVPGIMPGGEIRVGGVARSLAAGGNIEGGGYWLALSHYHPNHSGRPTQSLLGRVPSGAAGDIRYLFTEASLYQLGARSSRIYFQDHGRFTFTDYGIRPGHPDGEVWINYPDAATGARIRLNFRDIDHYQRFLNARKTTAARPAPDGGAPGLRSEGEPPGPDARPSPRPAGPQAVRRFADQLLDIREPRQLLGFLSAHGAARETLARAERWLGPAPGGEAPLRALGLAGAEPQAIARLGLLLNDNRLDLSLRQALSARVLEETRLGMVRAGSLEADEPLLLLFHGAPMVRARSIERQGIYRAPAGTGAEDDFGAAFYLSSGLDNAVRYAGKHGAEYGAIFPFYLSRRQMGTVVDVRPGGAQRAAWERFVLDNIGGFRDVIPSSRALAEARFDVRALAFSDWDAFGRRGVMFERFLQQLAAEGKNPALARPDIVLGELGGPFTSGTGNGDQQAARTARIIDELNRQLGHDKQAGFPQQRSEEGANRPRPQPPATPEAAALDAEIAAMARAGAGRNAKDHEKLVRQWNELAPNALRGIVRAMMPGKLSKRQLDSFAGELAASGASNAEIGDHAKQLEDSLSPGAPLARRLALAAERAAWPIDTAALDRAGAEAVLRILEKAALERHKAARNFLEKASEESRELLLDTLRLTGRLDERLSFYAVRRTAAGAAAATVAAETLAVQKLLVDPELMLLRAEEQRLFAATFASPQSRPALSALVGGDDQLRTLAALDPELVAARYARELQRLSGQARGRMTAGGQMPAAPSLTTRRFATQLVSRYQNSLVKPVLSELAAAHHLGSTLDLVVLKAEAQSGERANKPGIDIVGMLQPAADGPQGQPVRVLLVDDKALQAKRLYRVSALEDGRLVENLRSAIAEIDARTGDRPPAVDDNNDAGAQAAVNRMHADTRTALAQMEAAADALGQLPKAGASAKERQDHAVEVAEILAAHNIELAITSEYGSVQTLGELLQKYGFRLYL